MESKGNFLSDLFGSELSVDVINKYASELSKSNTIPFIQFLDDGLKDELVVVDQDGDDITSIGNIYDKMEYPLNRGPIFYVSNYELNYGFKTWIIFTQDGLIIENPNQPGEIAFYAWEKWGKVLYVKHAKLDAPVILLANPQDASVPEISISPVIDLKKNVKLTEDGTGGRYDDLTVAEMNFAHQILKTYWTVVENNRGSDNNNVPLDIFSFLSKKDFKFLDTSNDQDYDPLKDADYFLNQGKEKFEKKDYSGAIEDYNKAIELNSKDASLYQKRGKAKSELKDFQGSIEDFSSAIDIDPEWWGYYSGRGDAKKELKDFQGALEDYNKVVNLGRITAVTYHKRGLIKMELKDFQGAIEDFSSAIEIDPEWVINYYYRAVSKAHINDYSGAEEDYTTTLTTYPDNDGILKERGDVRVKLKKFELAVKDYRAVININPNNKWAYYKCGEAKSKLEDYQGAIEDFSSVIKIDSNYKWAYQERGESKSNLADYQGAIEDFSSVINIDSNYKWAYQFRGKAKSNLADYHGAIEDFNRVIEIDPNYKWAYEALGIAKSKLKDYAGAIEDFNKGIEKGADWWDSAYYNRGLSKHDLGHFDEAIEDYNKAIYWNFFQIKYFYNLELAKSKSASYKGELETLENKQNNTEYINAYFNQAKEYIEQNHKEPAIKNLDVVIELNPIYTEAYYSRAGIKYDIKDYKGAIADYDETIQLEPNHKNAYSDRGYTKGMIGDFKSAISDLSKAIELDSSFIWAYQSRGDYKSKLKDYDGAISDYNKVIELNPKSYSIYESRAKVNLEIKDHESALEDINKAIELDPQNVEFYELRSRIISLIEGVEWDATKQMANYFKYLENYYQLDFKDLDDWEIDETAVFVNELMANTPQDEKLDDIYNELNIISAEDFALAIEIFGGTTNQLEELKPDNEIQQKKDIVVNDVIKNAEYYYNQGEKKVEKEDYNGALEDFTRVIENDKADVNSRANSYRLRGDTKFKMKDWEGAIADYDEILKLAPKYAHSRSRRGLCKYELKNYKGALEDFSRAIEIEPTWYSYCNRGETKKELGDYKGAIDDYKKAIAIDPDWWGNYSNIGEAKYKLNDFLGAIEYYNKAIDRDANYADVYTGRGKAKMELKEYKSALEDINKAIELDPQNSESLKLRSSIKLLIGDIEGEEKQILPETNVIELDPNKETSLFRIKVKLDKSDLTLWEVIFKCYKSYKKNEIELEEAKKQFLELTQIDEPSIESSESNSTWDFSTEFSYYSCDGGHGSNIINDCIMAMREDGIDVDKLDDYDYNWNKLDLHNDKEYIQMGLSTSHSDIDFDGEYLIGECLIEFIEDCPCSNCINPTELTKEMEESGIDTKDMKEVTKYLIEEFGVEPESDKQKAIDAVFEGEKNNDVKRDETKGSKTKIGNILAFNDFDSWLSEMRNGQKEDKKLGLKKRKPQKVSETEEAVVRNIYEKINDKYKDIEGSLTFTYSPTGGCTVTYNKKKVAGFGFHSKGNIEILILRNYKKDYVKPSIKNLSVQNIRDAQISYKVPWGYAFFQVLDLPENITKNIDILIDLIGDGINTINAGKVLSLKKDEFPKLKPIFEGEQSISKEAEENHVLSESNTTNEQEWRRYELKTKSIGFMIGEYSDTVSLHSLAEAIIHGGNWDDYIESSDNDWKEFVRNDNTYGPTTLVDYVLNPDSSEVDISLDEFYPKDSDPGDGYANLGEIGTFSEFRYIVDKGRWSNYFLDLEHEFEPKYLKPIFNKHSLCGIISHYQYDNKDNGDFEDDIEGEYEESRPSVGGRVSLFENTEKGLKQIWSFDDLREEMSLQNINVSDLSEVLEFLEKKFTIMSRADNTQDINNEQQEMTEFELQKSPAEKMKKPPKDLTLGHAIAYISLYFARYNDGESTSDEFNEIYKILQYWMGADTSEEDLQKILIDTDEWFESGNNLERTVMLENIIPMIDDHLLKEIYQDLIRIAASNLEEFKGLLLEKPHPQELGLSDEQLADLTKKYPLLIKMNNRFKL